MAADDQLDAELHAMTQVRDILAPLEPAAQRRILYWAVDVFSISGVVPLTAQRAAASNEADGGAELPATFAEILELTEPNNNADRVLVAGFWIQEVQTQDAVDGRAVNKLLKEHGIDVSNVTNAFTALIERKPRLAIQAGKKGKFEKLYRLTTEGRKAVRGMMDRRGNNG